MCGMLIDDDNSIRRLRDDVRFVQLPARDAER